VNKDLYAAGFADGEAQAWKDRKNLIRRDRPEQMRGEFQRGWWDGYTPRSVTWRLRVEPQPWWQERVEEAA
jgi:hypothetical protein